MRHIDALPERHLQHLVTVRHRFIDDLHSELAGILRQRLKLQKLQLHRERRALHFKGAGDFLVRLERMDSAVEVVNVPPRVGGFELEAAMPSALQFQHLRAHPLLHDFRLGVGPEKQLHGQIELPRDEQFLLAVFGMYVCFMRHPVLFFGFILLHNGFQFVKPLFPQLPERFDEISNFPHLLWV